jgi:hypothetical protein
MITAESVKQTITVLLPIDSLERLSIDLLNLPEKVEMSQIEKNNVDGNSVTTSHIEHKMEANLGRTGKT